MDYDEIPCQVAYCDNRVEAASELGLVICEPCRQAIWGDEIAHATEGDCECPHCG